MVAAASRPPFLGGRFRRHFDGHGKIELTLPEQAVVATDLAGVPG